MGKSIGETFKQWSTDTLSAQPSAKRQRREANGSEAAAPNADAYVMAHAQSWVSDASSPLPGLPAPPPAVRPGTSSTDDQSLMPPTPTPEDIMTDFAPTRPVAGVKVGPASAPGYHTLLARLHDHALAAGVTGEFLPGGAVPRSSILRGQGGAYVVSATLETGASGKFRVALRIDTGEAVAIKEWRSEDAPVSSDGEEKSTRVSPRSSVHEEIDAAILGMSALEPHEVIDVDGKLYGVMRLMDGDLDKLIDSPKISVQERCALGRRMLIDVTGELKLLHAGSHVHRDIKPQNILWSRRDGFHLADYGLVEQLDAEGTFYETVGTPGFYPPEYFMKDAKLTVSVDVWSLARTYADLMLPGEDPFELDGESNVHTAEKERIDAYFEWRRSISQNGAPSAEAIARSNNRPYGSYFKQLLELDRNMCLFIIHKWLAPPHEREEVATLNERLIGMTGPVSRRTSNRTLTRLAGENRQRNEVIERLQVHRSVIAAGE